MLVFHRAARTLGDAAPDEDEKINPYAVSLDPDRWEADGLFDDERAVGGRGAPEPGRGPRELLDGGGRTAGVARAGPVRREMAKTFRKTPVQRVGTVFMTRMILLGVGGKGMTLLTVPDEESGSMQSTR